MLVIEKREVEVAEVFAETRPSPFATKYAAQIIQLMADCAAARKLGLQVGAATWLDLNSDQALAAYRDACSARMQAVESRLGELVARAFDEGVARALAAIEAGRMVAA